MIEKILEIFLPTFCVSCGRLGRSFCSNCFEKLKTYPAKYCFYCKKPSFLGFTHPRCRKKSSLDGVFSLFYYNEPLRKLLKAVKYRRAHKVFKDFLNSLPEEDWQRAGEFFRLVKGAILVPIPLHRERLLDRGFNQAEILASFLELKFGLFKKDLLLRKKDNPPQAFIRGKLKRYHNTRGLFEVKDEVEIPKRIILVDDVVTTGKTLEAAVFALRKKGALKIFGFTLAKG